MKRLLWWLLAGSRGGLNRGHLLRALRQRPFNAHQLAEELGLDYKTVRHHLDVLLDNKMVVTAGGGGGKGRGYGAMYFPSPQLENAWDDFEEVWRQVGGKEASQ